MRWKLLFLLCLLVPGLSAQTYHYAAWESNNPFTNQNSWTGLSLYYGRIDATASASSAPIKSGPLASAPTFCVPLVDLYIATDGTAGSQLYGCNASGNGFVQLAGGGPGGTPGGAFFTVQFNNSGHFGGIALGLAGQVLVSNGAGVPASFSTLVGSQLPTPTTGSLGGVEAKNCTGTGFVQSINTNGSITCGIGPASPSGSLQANSGSTFASVPGSSVNFTTGSITLSGTGSPGLEVFSSNVAILGTGTGTSGTAAGGEFSGIQNDSSGAGSGAIGAILVGEVSGSNVATDVAKGLTAQAVNAGTGGSPAELTGIGIISPTVKAVTLP